jgi:hypothetical protein
MRARWTVTVIAIAGCTLLSTPAFSQDEYPRVGQYSLDATFYPAEARMEARAGVVFAPDAIVGDRAIFYLHGELWVDSVLSGSHPVPYEQEKVLYDYEYSMVATQCTLELTDFAADDELIVFYSGYMNPSKVSSPSDYMRIDADGVFLRAYGYSLWFPVFLPARQDDYQVTFSPVAIRTPAEFRSVFLGTETNEHVDAGWRVTEWQAENISLFYAQCTAQRYEVTSEGNYFTYHYANEQSRTAAKDILAFAQRMNSLYDQHYRHGAEGGQFYIIEMPKYGDISSGNVTGLMSGSWRTFMDESWRQRALAHELVHPFVGVPVSRDDPLWSLAIEGFPSYFHLPILAEQLGDEWYQGYMNSTEERYLKYRETGVNRRGRPLPPEKPLLKISAEEMSTYKDEFVLSDRALLFLNYLLAKMGRDVFFEFTAELLNRDSLTAESFVQLIENYLPGSAKDVDLWLNTTEYPQRFHLANLQTDDN